MNELIQDTIPDDLIRIREAAKLVHCHWTSLYKAVRKGELAGWRTGPKILLVSKSEVLRTRIGRVKPKTAPMPVSTAVQRQRDKKAEAILKAAGIG